MAESSSDYEMEQKEAQGVGSPIYPSDLQEQILAILPIPSAILSIMGSSIIIYMAFRSRKQRKWTPYTRLLLAMSIYDILASVVLSAAAFLRPRDTSPRLLSFGTEATCNAVGFFNQVSYASIFYNGMLSFYFLLTARYGFSNDFIAGKLERWVHLLCIGFPLGCACACAHLGYYAESASGIGCWISRTPECDTNKYCLSRLMGYISYGFPATFIFVLLVINNTVILLYVRRQMKPFKAQRRISLGSSADGNHRDYSSSSDDESFQEPDTSVVVEPAVALSKLSKHENKAMDDSTLRRSSAESENYSSGQKEFLQNKEQARRLRLVSSQACLYVIFYLLCNCWTGVVGVMESMRDTTEKEMEMIAGSYTVFVLAAILTPLQGLFNMLVYIRPKYLKWRHQLPNETRMWSVRRAILGTDVKPMQRLHPQQQQKEAADAALALPAGERKGGEGKIEQYTDIEDGGQANDLAAMTRLPRDMMSSLTASQGDFDHIIDESKDDGRWTADTQESKGFSLPVASPRFVSSIELRSSILDVISELEECNFDTPSLLPEQLLDSSDRWCIGSSASGDEIGPSNKCSSTTPLSLPLRAESNHGPEGRKDKKTATPTLSSCKALHQGTAENREDKPMAVPQRRMSPPPVSATTSA